MKGTTIFKGHKRYNVFILIFENGIWGLVVYLDVEKIFLMIVSSEFTIIYSVRILKTWCSDKDFMAYGYCIGKVDNLCLSTFI